MKLLSIAALLLAAAAATTSAAPVRDVKASDATLRRTIDLPAPRAAHSATLLADGRVLLAGGCTADGCENGIARDAVLFDPASSAFVNAGALVQARVGQRAIALRDGSVLLFGGWTDDGATAVVERYDPRSGKFAAHGRLQQGRDGFTATPLADGTVLVAGGYTGAMQRLATAEIYDPRTRTSITVGALSQARKSHTATLLGDGRVLIAGGSANGNALLTSIELYDPATRSFSDAGNLRKARHKHAAVRIGDDVLLIGGAGADESAQHYADTERWQPGSTRTAVGPAMREGRYKFDDSVIRLDAGTVLVAGSGRRPELLRTDAAPAFATIDGDLGQKLSFSTVTRLRDGRVLITGGYDPDIRIARRAWLLTTRQ